MPTPPAARILIVDDEPALLKSLCDTLGVEGYETVGCNSGEAALKTLGASNYDLLLTDLMMPGMDGIALCQAAQKLDTNLVSIVMTGVGSIATAVKAMKAGALDYITKPLELSVILAVLSRSLGVHRLRLENAELARHVAKRTADLEIANRALRTSEEQLRALTHRVVQAQEAERGRVALELHGHITQLLCAVLVRSQTLANKLSARDGLAKKEAIKLRDLLGKAASEVERISRHLRPSILDELGLVALMRDVCTEFAEQTGVALRLTSLQLARRLPSDIELTLYRILQEALRNVEQHARARHATVSLTKQSGGVKLVIQDDGTGFEPKKNYLNTQNGKAGMGLLSMRERASYVGGTLKITSARRAGTKIEVSIPLGKIPTKERGLHAAATAPARRASKRAEARAPRSVGAKKPGSNYETNNCSAG